MTANLNLDSFRAMVGKDNYGEVRLNREGGLEKANNHFLQRSWGLGRQKIINSESQYIREMFMKAVANATVDQLTLASIREKLGIGNAGGDTSTAPLERRMIAEVLEMVDKSNSLKLEKAGFHGLKAFNTDFDRIFGYKNSFGDTLLAGTDRRDGAAPSPKQGVNVAAMRQVIKQWNGAHPPEQQIKLSDDQLTVLFNRHGLQLRNSVVGTLVEAKKNAGRSITLGEMGSRVEQDIVDAQKLISSYNKNHQKVLGDMICKAIRGILNTDTLESGTMSLGVQGETRSAADERFIRQEAGDKRTGTGFKLANSTLFMSAGGVARFCDNFNEVGNDAHKNNARKLSEETLFKPEDFGYEPYHDNGTETTQQIFGKTVDEVGRVPMRVVIQDPRGEKLATTQFRQTAKTKSMKQADLDEANKTNAKIKAGNADALTRIMDTIKENQLLSGDENQTRKLLKAMGQKFVASVTNDIGWNDRDGDRELVLKFNHDQTISAKLYFKTRDTGKRMEFDFDIGEHGAVERKYLGPQDQVEAAKAGGKAKVGAPRMAEDDLDLGPIGNEKMNAEDFANTINGWDD